MTRIWPVLSVVLAFMTRILPMVVVVLALLVTGVVHGLWTCRWDQVPDKETVIAPFKNLPLQMGEWEGTDLEASSSEIKGLTGYLSRRYVHPQTKDAVTISLMSGPPRVVAIHTPDVCYAALGYQVNTPARYRATDLPEATEFWTSDMVRTQSTDQNRLRIFWAWNATGAWTASDNPRLAFANRPVLYKLYLVRDLPGPNALLKKDPCLELMRQLQPCLKQLLFPENGPTS